MLIKNVTYNSQPDTFEIRRSGAKAVVLFPCDVEEIEIDNTPEMQNENESGLPEIGSGSSTTTQYIAHNVYYLETNWTANLEQRVAANVEGWKALAMVPESKEPTLNDVIEAVNALAEVVLGGE